MMWIALGRDGHRLADDARGVVMIEFLIAFGPLFLMFLATVQLALIGAAELIVRNAAVAGVRAAVVVLDDDPRFYDGAERGAIGDASDGARMAAIRQAVHTRMAAIAPDPIAFHTLTTPNVPNASNAASSVHGAIGTQPFSRLAFGLARYADMSTALTFPTQPGAATLFDARVDATPMITVRVTHLFACMVPVASALLCSQLEWDAEHEQLSAPSRRTGPSPQQLRELRLAPAARDQREFARNHIAVLVLQAEATLPSQSAAYLYASQRDHEASR